MKLPHIYDDEAICIYCGADGAETWHLMNNVRLDVGEHEFASRKKLGDFNYMTKCQKRSESE